MQRQWKKRSRRSKTENRISVIQHLVHIESIRIVCRKIFLISLCSESDPGESALRERKILSLWFIIRQSTEHLGVGVCWTEINELYRFGVCVCVWDHFEHVWVCVLLYVVCVSLFKFLTEFLFYKWFIVDAEFEWLICFVCEWDGLIMMSSIIVCTGEKNSFFQSHEFRFRYFG